MLKPSVIRSLIASILIATQVASLAVAQNQLPAMGDGADMTAGAERRIGERIVRELYRDPDYIDDPILGEYVQRIWQALLAGARARGELPPELDERFAWEILLGRDGSVNAFALPGGYLGLHLGLIGVVNSRDELASVLAHELTHVTQRHISRLMTQQNRQAPWMVGALILAALAASKSPEMANAVLTGGQALAAQNQLNFSRDMEREADRIGFGVMTQAGFEPSGFVTMFEKLQQASRLNDNGSFPYLRSHPLTTERIADMQSRVPMTGSPMGPQEPTMEHAMVAARARVLSYPGVDLLRAWSTEPELAGFASLSAPRRAAVLYTAALAAERLREYGRAIALVRRLLALTTGNAQASRQARLLAVDIALAANNLPLASSLMETLGVWSIPGAPGTASAGPAAHPGGVGPNWPLIPCRPGWPRIPSMRRPGRHCRRPIGTRTRSCARCGPRARSRWRIWTMQARWTASRRPARCRSRAACYPRITSRRRSLTPGCVWPNQDFANRPWSAESITTPRTE
jgi:predicted Zn-dependent protease